MDKFEEILTRVVLRAIDPKDTSVITDMIQGEKRKLINTVIEDVSHQLSETGQEYFKIKKKLHFKYWGEELDDN